MDTNKLFEMLEGQLKVIESYPPPEEFIVRWETGAINIGKPELISFLQDTCKFLGIAIELPAQQDNHDRIQKALIKAKIMLGIVTTFNIN